MEALKIKILRTGAKMPFYATAGSAGLDLTASLEEDVVLQPGDRYAIPTGLALQIPSGYGGFVFARSGLASKYGIAMANGVGVIDSDYTGEVLCLMQNNGAEAYTIHNGDRIAQLVLLATPQTAIVQVDTLEETERAAGGFGSTGR